MTKKELHALLANGKIAQVLAELQSVTAREPDLHSEVLQISAQFAENERQQRLNIAAPQDIKIEQNRINSVIIIIIDRLPDDSFRKKGSPNWEKIALWLGILAAVAGFTGYTIKDFLNEKEKKEVEQDKENLKNITESKKDESPKIESKASNSNSNKETITLKTSPTQKILKDRGEKIETQDVVNKPSDKPDLSKVGVKPDELGLVMRIFDLETGNPIEGVSVQLASYNEVIYSDKNGYFKISKKIIEQHGEYSSVRAYFNKQGYESTKYEIPLSESSQFKLKKDNK
jgi:hypothetical protein